MYRYLLNYDWPGNIRELKNNIERELIIGEKHDLSNNNDSNDNTVDLNSNTLGLPLREARELFERDYLVNKLKANNWNVTKTATTLNLDRVSLYRKIKSLKINLTE